MHRLPINLIRHILLPIPFSFPQQHILNPRTFQYLKLHTTRNRKLEIPNSSQKGRRSFAAYSVLVNDIHDDNELPVVLSIVYQRHPPDFHVPLERLQRRTLFQQNTHKQSAPPSKFTRTKQESYHLSKPVMSSGKRRRWRRGGDAKCV